MAELAKTMSIEILKFLWVFYFNSFLFDVICNLYKYAKLKPFVFFHYLLKRRLKKRTYIHMYIEKVETKREVTDLNHASFSGGILLMEFFRNSLR